MDELFGMPTDFEIKLMPWWIRLFAPSNTYVTFWGTLYCPDKVALDYISRNDYVPRSLFVHEACHVKQQRARGNLLWHLGYAFFKTYRYGQELYAYAVQLNYLISLGLKPDIPAFAKSLSNKDVYGYAVTYNKALKDLKELLNA